MSHARRKARKTNRKSVITITFTFPRSSLIDGGKIKDFFVAYRFLFVGLFLFAAIFFFSFPSLYSTLLHNSSSRISSKVVMQKSPIVINNQLLGRQISEDPPTRIIISSLSIDLPVVEAPVINGYWETSDTEASHGVGSGVPGQNGNMVIFAHARQGLFLSLRNIQVGADVYVMTKNRWFAYKVVDTKLVYPNQTRVISATKDQTLTLYTCDGYFDEKRLIVVAKPMK